MRRYVLALSALAAMSATAFAAEYYVVRDPNTKSCRVVETRPTDTKIVVMGNKAFATREKEGGPNNHHRGADQWLFVVEGTGTAIINGRKTPLKAGRIVLIEAGGRQKFATPGARS